VAPTRRTVGALTAVAAIVLGAVGVAVALTVVGSSGESGALRLHGVPPRTAELSVTINTSQNLMVTGETAIDFRRERLEADFSIPAVFNYLAVTAVLADDHAYLTTSNLQSSLRRPWVAIAHPTPDLHGLAVAMAHFSPRYFEDHLTGPGVFTVVRHGATHTYSLTKVGPFPGLTLIPSAPRSATVTVSVTVASEHQVSDIFVRVVAPKFSATVDFRVVAYNAPVAIRVPPDARVTPLPSSVWRKVLDGRLSLLTVLTESGIRSLTGSEPT
jgi:hypothetical protein